MHGVPMAPGLAAGMPVLHGEHDVDVPVRALAEGDVAAEQERLRLALEDARAQLRVLEGRIEKQVGAHDARIFSMQGLLLDDDTFREGLRGRIRQHLVNAEVAVRDEVAEWGQRLAAASQGTDRDPGADLRDIGRMLLRVLAGRPHEVSLGDGDEKVVLVTRELLPS
ncbi:MAG: hypothetical protein FJ296_08195, partial [Planctomycetes bacterium]|nr:hypothetical protein [Planctomycetota bacterium]